MRHHRLGWQAHLWPTVDLFWSQLCLAWDSSWPLLTEVSPATLRCQNLGNTSMHSPSVHPAPLPASWALLSTSCIHRSLAGDAWCLVWNMWHPRLCPTGTSHLELHLICPDPSPICSPANLSWSLPVNYTHCPHVHWIWERHRHPPAAGTRHIVCTSWSVLAPPLSAAHPFVGLYSSTDYLTLSSPVSKIYPGESHLL